MKISCQNELLYPGKSVPGYVNERLYTRYEQSDTADTLTSAVHWFDFQTREAHSLDVSYPDCFHKIVLCIAGNSWSSPANAEPYAFKSSHAIWYRTSEESYPSHLPGNTDFKLIHIHLTSAHLEMLAPEMVGIFGKNSLTGTLLPETRRDFITLRNSSKGLRKLLEEKLILDQLYNFAVQYHGNQERISPVRSRQLLDEALWHVHQSKHYLTIAELARCLGTNTFYLKKLFRQELHTSVFQYQSDLTLARSKQLLHDTALDVATIALQCGYESAGSFSNAFLRKYGCRPSAIRNSRSDK